MSLCTPRIRFEDRRASLRVRCVVRGPHEIGAMPSIFVMEAKNYLDSNPGCHGRAANFASSRHTRRGATEVDEEEVVDDGEDVLALEGDAGIATTCGCGCTWCMPARE